MNTRSSVNIPSILRGPQRGLVVVLLPWLIVIAGITGCSAPRSGLVSDSVSQGAELDAAYTILYELLDDEAQLDGILIVKSASTETEALLREIATSAVGMRDELKIFIDREPALTGARTGLPEAESDARSSISVATAATLLAADEEEFEILILMTQEKAMSYGQHLATSLADQDDNQNRAESLKKMSATMKSFHDRTRDLILNSCSSAASRN